MLHRRVYHRKQSSECDRIEQQTSNDLMVDEQRKDHKDDNDLRVRMIDLNHE